MLINNNKTEITDNICYNKNEHVYEQNLTEILSLKYGYDVLIVNSKELSLSEIKSRSNEILVEKCVCKIINDKGKAEILNSYEGKKATYIYTDIYNKGDYVIAYLVYNPLNKNNDIIENYFLLVSKKF